MGSSLKLGRALQTSRALSRRFFQMRGRKERSSSGEYPFWWMIFICLTIVDFPDSPDPEAKKKKDKQICARTCQQSNHVGADGTDGHGAPRMMSLEERRTPQKTKGYSRRSRDMRVERCHESSSIYPQSTKETFLRGEGGSESRQRRDEGERGRGKIYAPR